MDTITRKHVNRILFIKNLQVNLAMKYQALFLNIIFELLTNLKLCPGGLSNLNRRFIAGISW
jgi:hypothetical protein